MDYPYYTGMPRDTRNPEPVNLPVREREKPDAAFYKADPGLRDAVNVALLLGQPLLVTGDPGTGKTQLAYSLGWELGYDVFKFETKSTSTARDLFYTYDTLRRFHDAQLEVRKEGIEYLTYNALGLAILRSRKRSEVERWLPKRPSHNGGSEEGSYERKNDGLDWDKGSRSVVLIDEIDKAPRDFPNDLLNEIAETYFRIPEIGMGHEKIEADRQNLPVLIITSNSEKNLPDAFLRRCAFYHIPPLDRDELLEIAMKHLGRSGGEGSAWLDSALDLFMELRKPNLGLDRRPSTAELINWVTYLRQRGVKEGESLRDQKTLVFESLSALRKTDDDQDKVKKRVTEWLG